MQRLPCSLKTSPEHKIKITGRGTGQQAETFGPKLSINQKLYRSRKKVQIPPDNTESTARGPLGSAECEKTVLGLKN